jgi:ubiquitin-conjugating enzyme E2 O
VVYKKWLCRLEDVTFSIEVEFDDESICLISPLNPDVIDCNPGDVSSFYLQMEIDFHSKESREVLKNSTWIKGSYDKKKEIGRVIDVKPIDAHLEIASAHPSTDENDFPEIFSIDDLDVFSFYEYSNWSVGDKGSISEALLEYTESELKSNPKKISSEEHDTFSVAVILSKTFVDVLWEDGSVEKNINSNDLVSIQHVSDQDFLPEDIIQLKEDENKIGFVKSVDSKSKTCKVKWEEEEEVELMSIYDLKESKHHQFTLGSVVMLAELQDNKDWIGEVIGYKDGVLTISWLHGDISDCKYDEVIDSELDLGEEEESQNELLDLATQLMER